MMLKLLHVGNKSDLPQNRIQRFWQELDKDSGSVDFAEFTEWYLKYFNLAQELAMHFMLCALCGRSLSQDLSAA
ncbi:unnamed protein product [Symbiodinium pilosum]|uniref:EF-hand domain-containing protein n=1 Tax=Symbiodinium pilosum TaxID=2952 RepID=A0A812P3H6_SYMPI|nr:unnamed protein product [Symbiodinium pilosum]